MDAEKTSNQGFSPIQSGRTEFCGFDWQMSDETNQLHLSNPFRGLVGAEFDLKDGRYCRERIARSDRAAQRHVSMAKNRAAAPASRRDGVEFAGGNICVVRAVGQPKSRSVASTVGRQSCLKCAQDRGEGADARRQQARRPNGLPVLRNIAGRAKSDLAQGKFASISDETRWPRQIQNWPSGVATWRAPLPDSSREEGGRQGKANAEAAKPVMVSEERAAELLAENAGCGSESQRSRVTRRRRSKTTARWQRFSRQTTGWRQRWRRSSGSKDEVASQRATCRRDRDEERGHRGRRSITRRSAKGGCVTTYSLFHDAPQYATATFPAPRPFQEEAHEALRQGARNGIDVRC